MDRKYNDLIGDILENSGEKDNHTSKGTGKPLNKNYMERDILQNFQEKAKEAGFLPPWLRIQKEISSLIHLAETENDTETINQKIKQNNTMYPPTMQKYTINL